MMEIIPAIDIIDGKCVRLSRGDFDQKMIYNDDPLKVAREFEAAGIRRLHIVDLDGASGSPLSNLASLECIARETSLEIDFGGGIKSTAHLKQVLEAGAVMVSVGSVAVVNPELFADWIAEFGADRFLPGADVLEKRIRIHGWKQDAGIGIFEFIDSLVAKGIGRLFCTDISRDGMLRGPATDLYGEILERYPSLQLIASGGISSFDDLLALQQAGCSGAIVGKAIYEQKISMAQIAEFIKAN